MKLQPFGQNLKWQDLDNLRLLAAKKKRKKFFILIVFTLLTNDAKPQPAVAICGHQEAEANTLLEANANSSAAPH